MLNCLLMEFWEKLYSQTFVRNIVLECNHFQSEEKKIGIVRKNISFLAAQVHVYFTCGLCLGDITATKLTAIDNLRVLLWRIYGYMFVLSIY